MYRSFVEDSVYKHRGSRLSSQTPANKDYSRWPYSFEIREVLRDTLMTFFSLRSRRLEVVGAERARERETISRVVYKASCWDCQEFYIGKTKRSFNDRKTEHLNPLLVTITHLQLPPVGGEYYWEFLVGVCRPVLQILTLLQTKKCNFPHPFSHLAFRQKLCYHY